MSWENSIFNDNRSQLDSWQNRDSDIHMHVIEDMHMTRSDLRPCQELTNWEKDLVEAAFFIEDYSNDD